MGKKKEKKEVDKALEEYDDYLEKYFSGDGMDEEDEDMEFPFF